jgi:hypothetical protein
LEFHTPIAHGIIAVQRLQPACEEVAHGKNSLHADEEKGSMSVPAFIIAELKSNDGQMLTVLSVAPKDFKTGSRGYYANQKMEIEGKRYQVQIQLVEIGSKKATETVGEPENG